MDTDMVLTVPIGRAVSLCSGATIGYDIPRGPAIGSTKADAIKAGKQMKLLAGVPGHPLWKCEPY